VPDTQAERAAVAETSEPRERHQPKTFVRESESERERPLLGEQREASSGAATDAPSRGRGVRAA
jgi:hypothetical protein